MRVENGQRGNLRTATRRALAWVIGIVACGLLAYSCASSLRPNVHPDTKVEDVGGLHVLMETEPYEGDVGGVGISGKLSVFSGNCVGFTRPRALVVFPPGTEVSTDDGGRVTIHVAESEFEPVDLHIGDFVEAGIRSGPAPLSSFGGDLAAATPTPCQGYKAMPVDEFRLRNR